MSGGTAPFEGSTRSWLMVATGNLGMAVAVIHIYSMGVFIRPLELEFGWTRTEITLGLTVISVISVVFAPLVGLLIDRFGSRRVAIPGLAIYCSALALLSTSGPAVVHWWLLWLLLAAGSVLTKPTVWVTAIVGWFIRRRGFALALALCGTGVGSAIVPPIAHQLISSFGWREAYLMLGLAAGIVTVPMAAAFLRDAPVFRPTDTERTKPGIPLRQGLRSASFLKMALVAVLATGGIFALSVHFIPIMVARGVPPGNAAAIAGAIGVSSIIGRLAMGVLLDRFNPRLLGAIGLAIPSIACVLLLVSSPGMELVIAVSLGLALGAELDILAFLSARYFGLRSYGTLFGSISGLLSFGAGVGPLVASIVFDAAGSYEWLIIALIPNFLLVSLLIGSLGEPPDFEPSAAAAA